jgi:hypothetical protein
VYCVYGLQNVEEVEKALYSCRTCKYASVYVCTCVYAGLAAVPMHTTARTNSIKQDLPQESECHPARQQTFRLDVFQIFISPFAETAVGLYPHPAYSFYHCHVLVPFVST